MSFIKFFLTAQRCALEMIKTILKIEGVSNDKYQSLDYLCLSAQSALVGAVAPSLRAVIVALKEHAVILYFYYDREITYELEDLASTAATEVGADFPWKDLQLDEQVIRLDYPQKIPTPKDHERLVYLRKE